MGIHGVSPILNLPPSCLLIPSTGPERPVSCIELGLAMCFTYNNIHASMLFLMLSMFDNGK